MPPESRGGLLQRNEKGGHEERASLLQTETVATVICRISLHGVTASPKPNVALNNEFQYPSLSYVTPVLRPDRFPYLSSNTP